ncbi:MAG: hypothetical protein II367_05040 [Treponema sp.]|nr:hypothetical protein [Treponema sp.]
MKCTKIIAMTMMVTALAAFTASAKSKAKTVKQTTKMVLDFPGIEEGAGYPKWVSAALKQDVKQISKALNLKDRQVFFFTNKGTDLDFLQHWTDTVDMQAEIATSMSRVVERNVDALYSGGSAEVKKELVDKMNISSKVRLSGMVKEATFWVKYAAPKNPKQKIKKDMSNADVYYQYYVVYSMDKKAWDSQVQASLGDPSLNAEVSEYMLKNASGLGIAESDASSKNLAKAIYKDANNPLGGYGTDSLEESTADADYSWLTEE